MGRDFSVYKNNTLLKSPYDPRDYKLSEHIPLAAAGDLPDEYETENAPFVYDQGKTSMCCACAYNAIRYLQENSSSGLQEPLSPAFTYGNQDENETFEGMYLRSCCKKGREGSILLRELDVFYTKPEAMSLVKANRENFLIKADNYKIESFFVCNSRIEIQQAILEYKGVITGIPIYDCMFSVGSDGIVNYDPYKDIDSSGGHAVAITGWKNINNVFHWVVLNSWGTEWGDSGYCYLPESYPWIDRAYVVVDDDSSKVYEDYIKEFY
jgi:hypothetical protein